MSQRTDSEIAEIARRLATVLEDTDGHGTASWEMARARLGRELFEALGAALGEPNRGVQIGSGNIQTNTFG